MQNQYKESVLKNGLRVITKEDNNSPIITVGLFVKSGSRYEKEDEWGYAHVLEHMLSKGTIKRPENFGMELTRRGGRSNAHTSNEHLWLEATAIKKDEEIIFDLMSDSILNTLIDEETLENEKKVILEERQKAYENNERLVQILSREKLFSGHVLSREAIGSKESIKSVTTSKLKKYLNDFIVPENSALIVLGVDSHENVVSLANKYFSDWRSGAKVQSNENANLKVNSNYYFQEIKGNNYYLVVNYLTPGAKEVRQNAALALVVNFLGMGNDSVLNRELRKKRGLIYAYGISNYPFADLGRLNISTTTSSPAEAIEVISECVRKMPEYFTRELLEEIKTQIINSFIINNTNPTTELTFLGNRFIINNRLFLPEERIKSLNEVTYEDIIDVWEKYLQPENSLTVVLGPKDIKEELGF